MSIINIWVFYHNQEEIAPALHHNYVKALSIWLCMRKSNTVSCGFDVSIWMWKRISSAKMWPCTTICQMISSCSMVLYQTLCTFVPLHTEGLITNVRQSLPAFLLLFRTLLWFIGCTDSPHPLFCIMYLTFFIPLLLSFFLSLSLSHSLPCQKGPLVKYRVISDCFRSTTLTGILIRPVVLGVNTRISPDLTKVQSE